MCFCWRRLLLAFLLVLSLGIVTRLPAAEYRIAEAIDLDTVPSSFRVGFCLLTEGSQQYAAYYNANHQMVVASRQVDDSQWRKVELPTKVGFDSHNYITMAIDSTGHLHVSGNMHCVPLIYFRTSEPGDITTLQPHAMTGQQEQRCTYPVFSTDADGNLLYNYRDGGSGNGRRYFNRYDVTKKSWSRFLDTPLFEGQGERNAYPHGPKKGPDGLFHLVWVWRDTPDCATNHHLSYVRSRDLKNWESAGGKRVTLPLMLEQSETWVDPIVSGGGIINGCEKLTFDSKNRPIVSYHKRDDAGHMQIYVTRFEDGQWRPRPITAWQKEVPFSGRGTMPFIGIRISPLRKVEPDSFAISYHHGDYGKGEIVLDETTLEVVNRQVPEPVAMPASLKKRQIDFDGIGIQIANDIGRSGGEEDPDAKYIMRWECLGPNHDRPHSGALPPPSVLQVIKLERVD